MIFRATPQWFIAMDRTLDPSPLGRGRGPLAEGEWEGEGEASISDHRPHPSAACGGPLPLPLGEGKHAPPDRDFAAIADTRWIPEKGRNRIGAMVEGRPDWVISRQRAWGVPIALYRRPPHRRLL